MSCRTVTLMLAMAGCIGVFALPAVAQPARPHDYVWDHPCSDDPENEQTCEGVGQRDSAICWCQGEWDEEDHWVSDPDGWPDQSGDAVLIRHSNTGYCDGGNDDGLPCSRDGDCDGDATCDNYEQCLKIDVVTETVGSLDIGPKDTRATTDSLEVHFNNIGQCSIGGAPCEVQTDCLIGTCVKSNKTLNVGDLFLDAAKGPLTITVSDEVANVLLKTDTTD